MAVAHAQDSGAEIKGEAEQSLDAGNMQRAAPGEEDVRNQGGGVGTDPGIQHDPPQAQGGGIGSNGSRDQAGNGGADDPTIQRDPPQEKPISLPPVGGTISGPFFLYLLLAVLAVCLVIVAIHLVRTYVPNRRKAATSEIDAEASPIVTAGEAPPELDEIERLARAGKFAEAIHLMLLRTLDLLRRRLGANWASSLTSREIVRRSELGPTDRRALKVLVGAVELSRFGGQSANEQIYLSCLDHYRLIGVDLRTAEA